MKNTCLLLITIFCFSISAYSQNKAVFVGLEYQTKTGELLNGQKFDLGYRAGYVMTERFEKGLFKIEFSGAYKGAKFDINGNEAKAREIHVDVNFNSQWKVKELFTLGGGAFLSRVLFQQQDNVQEIRDLTNSLGFDMGFVGIVGKEFGRYLVELRYRKGLFNTGFGGQELRASDLGVNLFYLF